MTPPLLSRLRAGPILVAPGVYDPLSALLAEAAGCEAVFVSGASVALAQLGAADVGLQTATELTDLVARIADRVAVPVLVDGDQGFGNAAHVSRLVRAMERAGAAALQIEDQLAVKPASKLTARPLIPTAEMIGKLAAALDARRDRLLISARTDALASEGLDAALDRAGAYLEAGCDLLFVEGLRERAQATRVAETFGHRVPLIVNLLEGAAPFADAASAGAAGFALALFPATAIGAAADALAAAFEALRGDGTSLAMGERIMPLADIQERIGARAELERLARYGAPA